MSGQRPLAHPHLLRHRPQLLLAWGQLGVLVLGHPSGFGLGPDVLRCSDVLVPPARA
ncbi:hypothetical protein Q9Q99_19235 [Curtobacterium flaccumfaciens]|nr:hypothetical protein Q9Q99_19235 [Curtobacterium flaccumfaciens]